MFRFGCWSGTILVAAVLFVGCGAGGGTNDENGVGLPAPNPAREGTVPVPSTTTPVRLAPLDCTSGAFEVAERILIERRRGTTATDCRSGLINVESEDCWTSCVDGAVFVDFDLDPSQRAEAGESASGVETMPVVYAARYAAESGGTFTEAETLVLEREGPTDPWRVIDVEVTDTSAAQSDARATIENYFAALRDRNHATAASLMAPAPSIEGRDDLGRLDDEGFLAGTSTEQIAAALELWCDSGAACDATPDVEIEVTAAHTLRAIATYDLPLGTFETTFVVDDNGLIGLPIKVG